MTAVQNIRWHNVYLRWKKNEAIVDCLTENVTKFLKLASVNMYTA